MDKLKQTGSSNRDEKQGACAPNKRTLGGGGMGRVGSDEKKRNLAPPRASNWVSIASINKFLGKKRSKERLFQEAHERCVAYLKARDNDEFRQNCSVVFQKDFNAFADRILSSEHTDIGIDTETTGLDVFNDAMVGISFAFGDEYRYIPTLHLDFDTVEPLPGMVGKEALARLLLRLGYANKRFIFHNALFDIAVIHNYCGVKLKCAHDTRIAAKMLNENELNFRLKHLYTKYVDKDEGDETFSDLMGKVPFCFSDPEITFAYAGLDAHKTLRLSRYQKKYLEEGSRLCEKYDLGGTSRCFYRIEVPVNAITVDMKLRGIKVDEEVLATLNRKYKQLSDDALSDFHKAVSPYSDSLRRYYVKQGYDESKANEMMLVNPNSPKQLNVLFYEIMGIKKDDINRGKSDITAMESFDNEASKAYIAYKKAFKIYSTYIVSVLSRMREGRIHCDFDQAGTATGRFSSKNPNMQNIPARNTEIRQIFKADDGKVLIACDYSAQEMRIFAHLSKDKGLLEAYNSGKDFYSYISSKVFNIPYNEALHVNPDGSVNEEGKRLRDIIKPCILGLLYGMGCYTMAKRLSMTPEDAQQLIDSIYENFPGMRRYMDKCVNGALKLLHVKTMFGRKRRLPALALAPYEGLSFSEMTKIRRMWRKDARREFIETLTKNNPKRRIKDNTGKIAEARRQCVNAVVQGTASDQTKLAMVKVSENKELKILGYELLLCVHDELIGQAPKEHVKRCVELVEEIMKDCGKFLSVPTEVGTDVSINWYGEEYEY